MSKGIFISYRRAGNGAGFALSLYEGLRPIVGNDRVFFDVSHGAIDIGRSWREAVGEAEQFFENFSNISMVFDSSCFCYCDFLHVSVT